jgi:AraC family transcriptional regulator
MFPFKVIGFQKVFDNDTAYQEIPKFWDEVCEKYAANVYAGNAPANPYEKAIVENCIGEYGVCIDDIGEGKFRYLVAGKYRRWVFL